MFDLETDARPVRRLRTSKQQFAFFDEDTAPSTPVASRPINDIVRPCLLEIVHSASRGASADGAYERIRTLLATTKARLEALSLPRTDAADIHYALVAFADEAMQRPSSPLREYWQAHLLQLALFGENRAGEGFFERLQSAKADRRHGVLRVYQLCLLFGFHGIYARHGELERENLLEELRHELGDRGGAGLSRDALSPHGATPDEPVLDRVRNHLWVWLAALAALGSVAWYIGIAFTLDAQSSALRDTIERAREDLLLGAEQASDEAER